MYPGCGRIPHTGQPTQLSSFPSSDINPNSQRSHEETNDRYGYGMEGSREKISPRQLSNILGERLVNLKMRSMY
jgi:hypothetical protein